MKTDKGGVYVGKYLVVAIVFPTLVIAIHYIFARLPLALYSNIFEPTPETWDVVRLVGGGGGLVFSLVASFFICRRLWRSMTLMYSESESESETK